MAQDDEKMTITLVVSKPLITIITDFAFTTQPNTLKSWGMGALVRQAHDMF